MKEKKVKKPTGRPRAEIDEVEFEKLCMLQCTILEMCAWFNVTDKTLSGWCERTYNAPFSEIFELKRGKGKISLRRIQFRMAETSPAMAIWLGKQYLGQREKSEVEFHDAERYFSAITDAISKSDTSPD
jgi:hypothetical protein